MTESELRRAIFDHCQRLGWTQEQFDAFVVRCRVKSKWPSTEAMKRVCEKLGDPMFVLGGANGMPQNCHSLTASSPQRNQTDNCEIMTTRGDTKKEVRKTPECIGRGVSPRKLDVFLSSQCIRGFYF